MVRKSVKEKMEMYINQCEKCGRICRYKFGLHATSKGLMDCCKGKVRRIKFKNAW